MRTLLIDNYDSFTFNLYQLIAEVNGRPPTVVRNDDVAWDDLDLADFDNVVISPGPGRPEVRRDFGRSSTPITDGDIPVLGVCLGHQGICYLSGARIEHAPEPMHGRISPVFHDGQQLFAGIPSPFAAVRYHSLCVRDLPPELVSAAATSDGVNMAVRHRTKPLWGVQFHPESICTEHGRRLMTNFAELTARFNAGRQRPTPPNLGRNIPVRPATAAVTEARPPEPPRQPDDLHLFVRTADLSPSTEAVYERLFAASEVSFWLDSSRQIPGFSRFSFMGDASGPHAEHVTYDLDTRAIRIATAHGTTIVHGELLTFLEGELARRRRVSSDLPFDFNLGFVGYLGYELKGECSAPTPHRSDTPDAAMLFADRMLAFDHESGTTYVLALDTPARRVEAEAWMDHVLGEVRDVARHDSEANGSGQGVPSHPAEAAPRPVGVELRHPPEHYLGLIRAAQAEIVDGESYEVCLTNMLRTDAHVDPLTTYRALRRISPAPYAAILRFPDVSVLSASVERFLTIDRCGVIESKPIKGTRRRGATEAEDDALRTDLETSVKERAENLIIIDLVRNDLGKVCKIGSVHAPVVFGIESYATVHQLVSTIRGTVEDGASAVDCVRAAFPGGSMTGAPKLRTMEIIDRLEGGPRGVYSGALGYFALGGAIDLCMVIRTVVVTERDVTVGVGGAIVALSDAEDELAEILLKARALIQAIEETALASPVPGQTSTRARPKNPWSS